MAKRFQQIPRWLMCVLTGALLGCSQVGPQGDARTERRHDGAAGSSYPPHGGHGMQHRFDDAECWARRFESGDRDEWQKPDHVMALLDLAPDARVADIGSATGYFPVRFARAVPHGRVYGLDIEPEMVRYLNERAARAGLTNLRSILAATDDPRIPEPVDLIFVCNTYHHIGDRAWYFRARRGLCDGWRRPWSPRRVRRGLAGTHADA